MVTPMVTGDARDKVKSCVGPGFRGPGTDQAAQILKWFRISKNTLTNWLDMFKSICFENIFKNILIKRQKLSKHKISESYIFECGIQTMFTKHDIIPVQAWHHRIPTTNNPGNTQTENLNPETRIPESQTQSLESENSNPRIPKLESRIPKLESRIPKLRILKS